MVWSVQEASSLFRIAGIPEALGVAISLITLSMALSPWFGGLEIGPLKIAKIPSNMHRRVSTVGTILFISSVICFVPLVGGGAATGTGDHRPVTASVYKFSGQHGDYTTSGEIVLETDCSFVGTVHFVPPPTGGSTNSIQGGVAGTDIYWTRTMAGQHAGQTDHFYGKLIEEGARMAGAFGTFSFVATLLPKLDRCDP